jgi:hypothetical protein
LQAFEPEYVDQVNISGHAKDYLSEMTSDKEEKATSVDPLPEQESLNHSSIT